VCAYAYIRDRRIVHVPFTYTRDTQNITLLESMTIAHALQLEGRPTSRQSLSALITMPVPSLKSVSLAVAILELFTTDTLRYAVTLTFDRCNAFDL